MGRAALPITILHRTVHLHRTVIVCLLAGNTVFESDFTVWEVW